MRIQMKLSMSALSIALNSHAKRKATASVAQNQEKAAAALRNAQNKSQAESNKELKEGDTVRFDFVHGFKGRFLRQLPLVYYPLPVLCLLVVF